MLVGDTLTVAQDEIDHFRSDTSILGCEESELVSDGISASRISHGRTAKGAAPRGIFVRAKGIIGKVDVGGIVDGRR
jgi:hypothetical protein